MRFILIIITFISVANAAPPPPAPETPSSAAPNVVPTGKDDFKNPLYPDPNSSGSAAVGTNASIPDVQTTARPGLGYKSEILDGFYEDFVYEPTEERDPFSIYVPKSFLSGPITSPLQKYTLEELKLVAIVWNVKSPKAMVIDPSGTSHIIIENDKIGKSDGYVAKIREGEIVVIEVHADLEGNKAYLTKTMLLRKK